MLAYSYLNYLIDNISFVTSILSKFLGTVFNSRLPELVREFFVYLRLVTCTFTLFGNFFIVICSVNNGIELIRHLYPVIIGSRYRILSRLFVVLEIVELASGSRRIDGFCVHRKIMCDSIVDQGIFELLR